MTHFPSEQALEEGCADIHVLVDLPVETILRGAAATEEGPANVSQHNSQQHQQQQNTASNGQTDSLVGWGPFHKEHFALSLAALSGEIRATLQAHQEPEGV